jgi:multidrug resistance efflux pump
MGAPDTPQRSSRANMLVIGLGSGLLLLAAGVVLHVLTTRSRDAVVDTDFIEIASPIKGQLVDLNVEAGDAVQTGAQLAKVDDSRASDAEVRRLQTALSTAEAELERVSSEQSLKAELAGGFARDASDQRRLETGRNAQELRQLQADRAREQQELAFSERDLKRQDMLYRAGAIAENVVDRARTTLEQNRDQLLAIEARIEAQNRRMQATARDLSLDRTRGETDPLPRLQNTKLDLARLAGLRRAAERQVQGLTAQLETAQTFYDQQRTAWLKSPTDAVVWGLLARKGDTLRPQQLVLRLINCRSRWVTTYVSESDLKRLRIGSRARIDLIGENLDLRGRIDLIRSGVGRQADRENDPTRLPINLARESQVRVRLDSDMPAPSRKLCFVGYSARVSFQ